MPAVADLLAADLHEVFGNRDPASRRAAVESLFAPDVSLRTLLHD